MNGIVKSFVSEKKYGFIEGENKESYFVHINDTNAKKLFIGQTVTFDPVPTPKGLAAKKVIVGQEPKKIYLDPKDFIITKSSIVKGYQIVHIVMKEAYAESNNPNKAKDMLKKIALDNGANAVVNLTLKKYSKYAGCSNYQYTMHRFYGKCVIIKKVAYSNDSKKIELSNKEMSKYKSQTTSQHSNNFEQKPILVKPPNYILYPKIIFGILQSIIHMVFLSFGVCVGLIKKRFS